MNLLGSISFSMFAAAEQSTVLRAVEFDLPEKPWEWIVWGCGLAALLTWIVNLYLRDTTFAVWSLRLVGLMHEAGVPVGAGTDTPIGFAAPGYSLHSELEMLVRAGLSPMEALEAATVRPAEFFSLSVEMGTVEEGRLADLVLLSGNPLDDITNTRTVEGVVLKGEFLSRDELDALVR